MAETVTEAAGKLAVVVVSGVTGSIYPSSRHGNSTSDDKQLKCSKEQPGQKQHRAEPVETLSDSRNREKLRDGRELMLKKRPIKIQKRKKKCGFIYSSRELLSLKG
jgi:hypothetical protein